MNQLNKLTPYFLMTMMLLLGASCASRSLDIDYDPIGGQYSIIPETKNKLGKPEFGVRSHVSNNYDLGGTSQSTSLFSNDPGAVRLNRDNPTQEAGLGFGAFGSLGLAKYVDFLATKSTQGLLQGGINLCLFKNCGYEDQGWKFSIYALAGYQSEDETSSDSWFSLNQLDEDEEFDNVGGELELSGRTAGFTMGYREAHKLFYTNFTYSYLDAESTVTVTGQTPVEFKAVSETYGAMFGYRNYGSPKESGRRTFFYLEGGYNHASNRGTRRFDRDGFMGSFGFGMAWL